LQSSIEIKKIKLQKGKKETEEEEEKKTHRQVKLGDPVAVGLLV
jgi:hypothetical protein